MVTTALFVRLEAKPGKEPEVEKFLQGRLPIVEGEPETTAWFGLRLRPRSALRRSTEERRISGARPGGARRPSARQPPSLSARNSPSPAHHGETVEQSYRVRVGTDCLTAPYATLILRIGLAVLFLAHAGRNCVFKMAVGTFQPLGLPAGLPASR